MQYVRAAAPCTSVATLALAALAATFQARAAEEPVAVEPPPKPVPSNWEGAVGLIVHSSAEYQGGASQAIGVTPAFYLRYKRLTISNSSGFVNRRSDDVLRGLGLDLVNRERVRVNLALRFDRGRQESSSDDLRGMGDVKATLRLRVGASWEVIEDLRLGASWSVDAFGRGGGNFGDVSVVREKRLCEGSVFSVGSSLSFAGDRYLQSYYGVSEEQSGRTRYARYEPSSGLRDVAVFAGLRGPLGPHWSYLAGVSASRLLGPAADSPLVSRPTGWGANAGIAWRF